MSLASDNKPPRHAAIGKRLALLLEKGSTSDRTLTTCVAAAGKAADRGLISIVEYRDTNWKITSDRAAAVSCYYRLTDSGEELRGELIKGGAAVAPAQNDRQLKWLLDQTCRSVYEDYGEPDEGFYCGDELNTLASSWVDTAIAKLELPTDHTGKFSVKPEKRCREPIIAESIMRAHNTGLTLCFYILPTFDLFKAPLYVVIELNVENEARTYFARVLDDYPKVLEDICQYSGMLKFENPVGLKSEPKRGSSVMDFLRAYISELEEDDEEHFIIRFDAYDVTTRRNVHRAVTVLVALYDAASASLDAGCPQQDRLLRQHKTLIRAAAGK